MEEFFPPERSAQKKTASSIVEPDFGQAEYIESTKTDKYFLLCRSPTDKDCCYLFQRQSTRRRPNGDYTMYWRCVRCMQISSASPANVIVRNERLTKDPSIGHYEACIPYTDSEIQLMKVKREMRRRVLNDGVRPLLAYQEAVEQLRLQVSNPAQLANLEREIGQYKSNRSSLYRCALRHSKVTGKPNRWARERIQPIPPKRAGSRWTRSAAADQRPGQLEESEAPSEWNISAARSSGQSGWASVEPKRPRISAWQSATSASTSELAQADGTGQAVEVYSEALTSVAALGSARRQDDETSMAIQCLKATITESETVRESTPVRQYASPAAPMTSASPTPTRQTLKVPGKMIPVNYVSGKAHIMVNGVLRPVRFLPSMPKSSPQRPRPPTSTTIPGIRTAPATPARSQPKASPAQGSVPAKHVITALSKALDVCKKRSRWETFGDYVGKTLDSLPEENARKVSREIQQLLNREQDAIWANGLGL